ncbi:Chitooligosaccharide deacetylase ChbG [bacterium HR39]|nr:Chitooligosaccharide deacetylase ChbG [bacterium HR39]
MPSRLLIVTADDFGLCAAVSDAVVAAHDAGIVTSASLLATCEGFATAARLARTRPGLDIGVHVVLAWGRPLSPPREIPSLVRADGGFLPRSELLRRAFAGRIRIEEAALEIGRQIARVLEAGLRPVHINGDRHVHTYPGLREVFVELARTHGLASRVPGDRIVWCHRRGDPIRPLRLGRILARRLFGRHLAAAYRRLCLRAGVPVNAVFLNPTSVLPAARLGLEAYRALFARPWQGAAELMTHPASCDDTVRAFWDGDPAACREREDELRCLLSPAFRDLLEEAGVRPVGHRALRDAVAQPPSAPDSLVTRRA